MDWPVVTVRPAEAAVIAQVSLNDVDRTIDSGALPDAFVHSDTRVVLPSACVYIAFYVSAADQLTAELRADVISRSWNGLDPAHPFWASEDLLRHFPVRSGFVTVDLAPFVNRARDGWLRLEAMRDFAVCDPDILGGSTPVIRGTRVPVYDVAANLETATMTEVLEDFPTLRASQVEMARAYAAAYPPRLRSARRRPKTAHRTIRVRRTTA